MSEACAGRGTGMTRLEYAKARFGEALAKHAAEPDPVMQAVLFSRCVDRLIDVDIETTYERLLGPIEDAPLHPLKTTWTLTPNPEEPPCS